MQKWLFVVCCLIAGYHALNAWSSRPFNEKCLKFVNGVKIRDGIKYVTERNNGTRCNRTVNNRELVGHELHSFVSRQAVNQRKKSIEKYTNEYICCTRAALRAARVYTSST